MLVIRALIQKRGKETKQRKDKKRRKQKYDSYRFVLYNLKVPSDVTMKKEKRVKGKVKTGELKKEDEKG